MRLNVHMCECGSTFHTSITGLQSATENDYNKLRNKPTINSIVLEGALNARDLGLGSVYYDTTANWNMQSSLIAEEGTIYVYSDYYHIDDGEGNMVPVAGIKIGDGNAYLIDMPFVTDALTSSILTHVSNTQVHVTPQEKAFWNNKVSSFLDGEDAENLIISKTHYEIEGEIHNG